MLILNTPGNTAMYAVYKLSLLWMKGLDKMTENSVYQYVHSGLPSSPEVSSERRMWFFLMTKGHKSQKQYILENQSFH